MSSQRKLAFLLLATRALNEVYSQEEVMETVKQEQIGTPEEKQEQAVQTFTQDDVNRIVADRLSREREKYADYESIKEKAAKFDEAEEASKTELQKATERADKLQAQLECYQKAEKVRAIHEEVSKTSGVPAHLLTGETKEDCEAQAKAIMSFAKPEAFPVVPDGGEVRNTGHTGSAREQFAEWANENFITGGN